MLRMSDGSNVGVEDGIEDVSVLGLEYSVEAGFVAGVEDGLVEGSIEWGILIANDDEFQPHPFFDWNSNFISLCLHYKTKRNGLILNKSGSIATALEMVSIVR